MNMERGPRLGKALTNFKLRHYRKFAYYVAPRFDESYLARWLPWMRTHVQRKIHPSPFLRRLLLLRTYSGGSISRGGLIDGQSKNSDRRVLSSRRLHFRSRALLTLQTDGCDRRASADACGGTEMSRLMELGLKAKGK